MTHEDGFHSKADVTKEGQNILLVFRLFYVSVHDIRHKDLERILAGKDVLCCSLHPSFHPKMRAPELRRRRGKRKQKLESCGYDQGKQCWVVVEIGVIRSLMGSWPPSEMAEGMDDRVTVHLREGQCRIYQEPKK